MKNDRAAEYHRAALANVQRRTLLGTAGYGLRAAALGALGQRVSYAAGASTSQAGKGVITKPHFPVRAKRVIHLCMAGGPSQFDAWPAVSDVADQGPATCAASKHNLARDGFVR